MSNQIVRAETFDTQTSVTPAAAPEADRRTGQRFMTILRVGKMISAAGQELCLIRNISEGGLMAHVYSEHRIGDRVTIEFKSDQRAEGVVRWVREENVGVEFDEKIDVAQVLRTQPAPDGKRPRSPRLEVRAHARLKVDESVWRVELRDLSQGGAKICIEEKLPVDQDAVVTIDGLRPLKAIIRWQDATQAGLEFLPAIPFDELIQWLGLRSEPDEDALPN